VYLRVRNLGDCGVLREGSAKDLTPPNGTPLQILERGLRRSFKQFEATGMLMAI